jgi:hypothetical protein
VIGHSLIALIRSSCFSFFGKRWKLVGCLDAFTEGNNEQASESWKKLLSRLPINSPMKLELSKKLQSIKDKN